MSDFPEDESKRVQYAAPRRGRIRPAARAELATFAALLLVSVLAVVGALLFVYTDADSEPPWIPAVLWFGAALAVASLALLIEAAQHRRTFLAQSVRLAMWLEARDPIKEIRTLSEPEPDPPEPEFELLLEALDRRDALLASGDFHEADRLNAALPARIRRAWPGFGSI